MTNSKQKVKTRFKSYNSGASMSQPSLAAKLQKEYETSFAKLLPLKERLALTDKLVEQVVYKLDGGGSGDCGGEREVSKVFLAFNMF